MKTNQKGITLIALVITIIVLLILAGVSIAMLTGENGILTQANKSTVTNIEGRVNEEVRLSIQATKLAIENKTATDYSWSAINDVKKAGTSPIICSTTTASETTQGTVISTLIQDLKAEGYKITASAAGDDITIEYAGSDYGKATNKPSTAKITYKLTVTQHEVKLTTPASGSTNPTYTK